MFNVSKLSISLLILSALIAVSFAKTSGSKTPATVKANKPVELPSEEPVSQNLFLRFAKSLAVEAVDDFKNAARRNSKQMDPNEPTTTTTPAPDGTDLMNAFNLTGVLPAVAAAAGIPVTIKLSAISVKAAILTGIAAIKAAIIQILLTILWFAFLISGTAYFVCNLGIVSCSGLGGGSLGGIGGGLGGGSGSYGAGGNTNTAPSQWASSRSGVQDQYDRLTHPVYKALDEGYKKFR